MNILDTLDGDISSLVAMLNSERGSEITVERIQAIKVRLEKLDFNDFFQTFSNLAGFSAIQKVIVFSMILAIILGWQDQDFEND